VKQSPNVSGSLRFSCLSRCELPDSVSGLFTECKKKVHGRQLFSFLKGMAEAMGISLKTEQRRSHSAVSSYRPWVRRAEGLPARRAYRPEGYQGTCRRKLCMEVPVKLRRPPSLPLVCELFPCHSSFSVLRETPMAFSCSYFKNLNCYHRGWC
jgi:hypothetical protein